GLFDIIKKVASVVGLASP
uniref:Citropin-1.2.4 n=1 Tax=Ranoidea citropa TaxID=94770 RepID=CT124_RANCI|nr:RecName: Full=Citropin-1.2.4 [Ranoidea citropa]